MYLYGITGYRLYFYNIYKVDVVYLCAVHLRFKQNEVIHDHKQLFRFH